MGRLSPYNGRNWEQGAGRCEEPRESGHCYTRRVGQERTCRPDCCRTAPSGLTAVGQSGLVRPTGPKEQGVTVTQSRKAAPGSKPVTPACSAVTYNSCSHNNCLPNCC